MLSSRGATACAALVAVLLVFAMPTGAGAVAADDGTASSTLEYFLGDLFQGPVNKDPKAPPRFRPWQIFDVSGDGVLAFDCAGGVPTLRLVLRPADHPAEHGVDSSTGTGTPPPDTCGGGPRARTPVQYKFSRADKPKAGYSALFWARPSRKNQENGARPLMPLPKLQLKAILKALAALMESAWRDEMGEAMPESVPFPADTVGFYIEELRSLVLMGREDVEFHKPWEKLDGEIRALTLGGTIVWHRNVSK